MWPNVIKAKIKMNQYYWKAVFLRVAYGVARILNSMYSLNWIIMETKLTTKYYQMWIAICYLVPIRHLTLVWEATGWWSLCIFNHQYWSAIGFITPLMCLLSRNFQESPIYFLKPFEWQVLWKTPWHVNCTSEIETHTSDHNFFCWRHFRTRRFDL